MFLLYNFKADPWHTAVLHSWVRSDQLRFVYPAFPVLLYLQQQLIHETAKLRTGAVKRQGLLSVVGLINLLLRRHSERYKQKIQNKSGWNGWIVIINMYNRSSSVPAIGQVSQASHQVYVPMCSPTTPEASDLGGLP